MRGLLIAVLLSASAHAAQPGAPGASGVAEASSETDPVTGVVRQVRGSVMVSDAPRRQERPLRAGDVVKAGEYVRTGADGSVTFVFGDDKPVSVGPNSTVQVGAKTGLGKTWVRGDGQKPAINSPDSLKAIR